LTWTPQHSATDVRAIAGNLITFFETNQSGAFEWARSGGGLPALTFYRTAQSRIETNFPHFGLVGRRVEIDDADDGLRITYTLTFELEIAAEFTKEQKKAALVQLQADTDSYVYAIESMYLNIPNATLFTGIHGAGHGYRSITGHAPLEAAAGDAKAMFQTQMTAVLRFTENP
jgi:hypothetical protein